MCSVGRKPPRYTQIREEVSSWALSPGRVAVHRKSREKRTQQVEKPPGTLEFERKSSPGHERIAVHRNSLQERAQRIVKPPR